MAKCNLAFFACLFFFLVCVSHFLSSLNNSIIHTQTDLSKNCLSLLNIIINLHNICKFMNINPNCTGSY